MFDAVVRHAPKLRAAGVLKLKLAGDGITEIEFASTLPIPFTFDEPEPELPRTSLDVPGAMCATCGTNERRYGDLCRSCARGAVSRG